MINDLDEHAERPQETAQAVRIIILAAIVDATQATIEFPAMAAEIGLRTAFITIIILYAVLGLLVLKIAKGKNWARLGFLSLYLLGLMGALFPLEQWLVKSVVELILDIGLEALYIYGLVYLFSHESNQWFAQQQTGNIKP